MLWIDYIVLILSIALIAIVMMQDSKDDINDAFNGSKSELFKNQKTRGLELVLQRTTIVLGALFIASVVTSVALHQA
ncbi:MAG: preprotein translocase subunit SecG [Roseburia sp.]|nr:preprotein translocase subunit SecG [Anaeroplasma bactoclasticum]MCM1196630.1 preprotein translocase subunit SecG [Roseburia sp.]MCM1557405.1 preprotein translocase subunit SecG [Anaeroplasma bactoclasticum]